MAEGNGTGRLDRIEAVLERVSDDIVLLHSIAKLQNERFTAAQTTAADERRAYLEERKLIDARLDAMAAQTDKRIADLVGAIGQLIEKEKA
jgi:hypothetical protein